MQENNSIGKPGSETSEFKTTKWAMLASTLLPVACLVLDGLSDSGVIENKLWLCIIGGISSTLAALGYSHNRSKIKSAEALALGQIAAAKELNSKHDTES